MAARLLLLFSFLRLGTTLPDLDDNMVPTDDQILNALLQQEKTRPLEQGQPEVEDSLGLPSDEESYNELKAQFALGFPFIGGTRYYISDSFPEVDARGFHESVFDGFNDYYPQSRRLKRDPLGINSRGFHDDVFNRDFGSFHTVKRAKTRHTAPHMKDTALHKYIGHHVPVKRQKRETEEPSEADKVEGVKQRTFEGHKERQESNSNRHQRDTSSIDIGDAIVKRRPDLDNGGFNGDKYRGAYSDIWTMDRDAVNSSGQYDSDNYWIMHKRKLGIGPSGFHGDTVTNGFGDFSRMKKRNSEKINNEFYKSGTDKRKPEMDSTGFHGDTFSNGFGNFWTMKRKSGEIRKENALDLTEHKRRPEMDSSGFHGDTFKSGFGDFWTMKKRRPEMDSSGFHGDTFNSGFGDFWTMKKRRPEMDSSGFHGDTFNSGFGDFWTMKKRKPDMDPLRFNRDLFNGGFGKFWTTSKRRQEMDSSGLLGDTYSSGFGDILTLKKRKPKMYYAVSHSNISPSRFGDLWPINKRKPEMDLSGFHGDTFNSGFGDFWPVKKRRPEMDSSGFHGDTFSNGFGDFWPVKKRRPEMDSSGFHGDTFSSGFGDFWTMKKRIPEVDSSGFHGDTFHGDFGNFWTMKKRSSFRNNYINDHNIQPYNNSNDDSVNAPSSKSH